MSKNLKMIATLMIAIIMVAATKESASAATYNWGVAKTPGYQTGMSTKEIPLYKGEMTFKVTNFVGNCSYLVARCSSANGNYYYIDNTSKSVSISKLNGQQSFHMKFINDGDDFDYMNLAFYIDNNAGIGETVSANGIIFY